MKEKLPENIRALRKNAGMRQEELAEALGVSVGAVSKWERGAAAPDLRYMIALAQVFGVSTDALLGFELENTAQNACVDQILALLKAHNAAESLTAADEALRRYPNSFQIVHTGALAYRLVGGERKDKPLLKKAIALYERALLLLPNSGEKQITAFSLRNDIAYCYLSMRENERAIQILEGNNPAGVNDAIIGLTRAKMPSGATAALTNLSDAFARQIASMFQILQGFSLAFRATGRTKEACEAMDWLITLLHSLGAQNEQVSTIDKMESGCRAFHADLLWKSGQKDEALSELRLAREAAERFDKAPNYDLHIIRFCSDASQGSMVYDDMGKSAKEAAQAALSSAELLKIWEELS